MWKAKLDYISGTKNNQSIIIGDSKAVAGFEPEKIDKSIYNLAIGGSSPIEGYYFLKKLLSNGNVPGKIIISYSPYHLEADDVFFERTVRYDALSKKEQHEILSISNALNEKFFISPTNKREYKSRLDFYQSYLRHILISYKFFMTYRETLSGMVTNPKRPIWNYESYNKIKQSRGHHFYGMANSSADPSGEIESETFMPSKVINYYLINLLELATKNRINIYYVNMPFNEASYKKININYIDGYYKYFNKLKIKYKNVVWLNDIYFYNNDCFGDPSHLNKLGSKKFSLYISDFVLN